MYCHSTPKRTQAMREITQTPIPFFRVFLEFFLDNFFVPITNTQKEEEEKKELKWLHPPAEAQAQRRQPRAPDL